jgi:hypothetical protein
MDTKLESETAKAMAFQRPQSINTNARGWGKLMEWAKHNIDNLILRDTLTLQLKFSG